MPKSEQNRTKSVALTRTAASAITGSQSTSTKTVSMPAATVHNYNNYDRNGKGVGIKQTNFAVSATNLTGRAGVNYGEAKNKIKSCKTASQRISECQRDHLAFQAFLRTGSAADFTNAAAAIQQPGMGSRQYEKATTLPSTSASTSQNFNDKAYQFNTKSSLGNSVPGFTSSSSSASSIVGSGFWSRTTGAGKSGGHPPSSTFQDFDDSVSDAWDIQDDRGLGYGGSGGLGSVIDVQPTSVSPFSVAKLTSLGPGIHGKHCANKESSQLSVAKKVTTSASTQVANKPVGTGTSPNEEQQPHHQDQDSNMVAAPSTIIQKSSILPSKSSVEIHAAKDYPTSSSTAVSSTASASHTTTNSMTSGGKDACKLKKNHDCLSGENKRFLKLESLINDSSSFDLEELRKLAWSGISAKARPKAWKILCGYLPPPGTAAISPEEIPSDKSSTLSMSPIINPPPSTAVRRRNQEEVVQRKQAEYNRYVEQYFTTRHDDDGNGDTYRQIHIDIPRMSPVVGLFQQRAVQEIFERILYIWAIRHPASGYVQGINDLVTPFFLVFLHDFLRLNSSPETAIPFQALFTAEVNNLDVESLLSKEQRDSVEADAYWCITKVLDGIQDNYTFAQPGIQLKVRQLEDLTRRIDQELHDHLVGHDVAYLQFAFRWMNNLLMRELPVRATVRLWDTYLAQADGFSHFHLYVCGAFLCHWKSELMKKKDFHTLLMFLQNVPTAKWGDNEINLLVAEAYRLSYLFAGAPSHLSGSSGSVQNTNFSGGARS